MRNCLFLTILLLGFLLPNVSIAGHYEPEYILGQIRSGKLPAYCAYMGVRYWPRTLKGKQLRKKYGPDLNHMHHYTFALLDSQRGKHSAAIDNLDYVLRNIDKMSRFRPMVLIQKATILYIMNRNYEAVAAYLEVIAIKPDSEQAYLGVINTYKRLNDTKNAELMAHKGLENIPKSEKLRKILTK